VRIAALNAAILIRR
jgi:hypothetical protein